MPEDFYGANAEWYAALVAGWREETDAAVRSLLGPIDGGDVVDVASGVGACLPLLRDLGAEQIFAVEPSRSMRAGLMTTVARDTDLLARTTVITSQIPEALEELPPRWSAGVMLNAIGHLSDDARVMLWTTLRDRLVPQGRFVISLQPPEAVTTIPWTDFGTVHIGRRAIRTRGRAEPLDMTRVVWTMEWCLVDANGEVLEERTATHPWRALSHGDLIFEAGEHGLGTVGTTPPEGPFIAFGRRH